MSSESFQKVVNNYLLSRGYESIPQNFTSYNLEEYLTLLRIDQETTTVESPFSYNFAEISPASYTESYQSTKEWVLTAKKRFRKEMILFLYPLWVHCYLELIHRGYIKEAKKIFDMEKDYYMDTYEEDLQQLEKINSLEDIQQSELAQNFVNGKYQVRVSNLSFQIFNNFLLESDYMFLTNFLNQFIDVRHTDINNDELELFDSKKKNNSNKKLFNPKSETSNLDDVDDVDDDENLLFLASQEETDLFTEEKIPEKILEPIDSSIENTSLPSISFYTFFQHQSEINTFNITSDSKYILSGFGDSSVRLWDLFGELKNDSQSKGGEKETMKTKKKNVINNKNNKEFQINKKVKIDNKRPYKCFYGHRGPVYSCCFSQDNKYFLTSSMDSTVRLWDSNKKECEMIFVGHNYPVWDVKFSRVGYYFVTGSFDHTARLWSTFRNYPLRVFVGHFSDVDCVDFHPNCNYVATGSSDKTARIFDIQTSRSVRIFFHEEFKKHGTISAINFSPNGKLLATGTQTGWLSVWDIGQGKAITQTQAHTKSITSLEFDKTSSMIASGSLESKIKIWNPNNTENLCLGEFQTNGIPTYKVKWNNKGILCGIGAV
ncbi:transcription initiation factor tfiid [Anaeramoeba flamelloides]|uniref:Transcription initiation factor tfiid n=1 Tax=Anaeramoeba flamelloides TaxID=1746091 RepID=A0ABQ8YZ41_9EUKA|nr:transcription initiation factor tfiid [Anaeramoeba flamelloides]